MLNFERFRGVNARPFPVFDLNLRNQGLVRMVGPNGAGKSSIWHLLSQVVQGTNPNQTKTSELQLTDKNYLLEVTFERNGSQYVAAHAVKSKELSPQGKPYGSGIYLFRDKDDMSGDISKHRDTETQKLIRSTFGWTKEEWYGYVYLAQQTVHTLINGSRSDRQKYLSALFNLLPLDTLAGHYKLQENELAELIKSLERDKQELSIKIQLLAGRNESELQGQVDELNDLIAVAQVKIQKLQAKQEKFRRLETVRLKLSSLPALAEPLVIPILVEKLEGLKVQQETNRNQNAKRSATEDQIRRTKGSVVKPSEALPADSQTIMQYQDINLSEETLKLRELQELQRNLKEVLAPQIPADFDSVLVSPDIDYMGIYGQIQILKARPPAPTRERPTPEGMDKLRTSATRFERDIQDAEEELKHLSFKGEKCPTCGTELDVGVRTKTAQSLAIDIQGSTEALEIVRHKLKAALVVESEWQTYDKLGPDRTHEIPTLQAQLELSDRKSDYKKIALQKESHERYCEKKKRTEQLPALEISITQYKEKQRINRLHQEWQVFGSTAQTVQTLEAELKSLPAAPDLSGEIQKLEDLMRVERERVDLTKESTELEGSADQTLAIREVQHTVEAHQNRRGGLLREIQEVQSISRDIATLQQKIQQGEPTYRNQLRKALLAKGFGKAGVLREKQLARFSGYLREALMSHTMRLLPDHRLSIEVDDGVDFLTSKKGSAPYDICTMSGGEKGAMSIAFLFALDDLLPPDRRSNLKVIDEIESGFDQSRQKDFIAYTLPELRKRAETVVIISHTSAANAGEFDRTWEIRDEKITETVNEVRSFEPLQEAAGG